MNADGDDTVTHAVLRNEIGHVRNELTDLRQEFRTFRSYVYGLLSAVVLAGTAGTITFVLASVERGA